MLDLKKSNFENTVLVGVTNSSQDEFKLNEYLEELGLIKAEGRASIAPMLHS